jgi:hypothetical protein
MTSTTITFDGGTIGADIAAGSNGIQSVPDTPAPKFVTGFHGAAQVRSGGSSNTTNCRFRVDTGISGDQYISAYLKYNTAHTSSGNFCIFLSAANSSNTTSFDFRVGSNKEFNIRVGASTVVRSGSTNDIPVNSEFRLDFQITGTTCNWRIFYNPEALNTTTPDLSGTFTFTSATISRLVLGATSSSTLTKDWSYDTIRANNTGWHDAFNPAAPGPTLKVWNGSAEVVATYKVWNGSAEVAIGSLGFAP